MITSPHPSAPKKPVPPSFFQMIPGLSGDAGTAEVRAMERRRQSHVRLGAALRNATAAASAFRALDATRQTRAGIEHVKAHRDRIITAFDIFITEAEAFAEQTGADR